MKSLNFNNIGKKFLTITLNDEKSRTILVKSPTKKVMDYLMAMENKEANDMDRIADLYDVCSEIMSRNKANVNIPKALLEEIFDVEDIMTFLNAYMEFISEQMNGKN